MTTFYQWYLSQSIFYFHIKQENPIFSGGTQNLQTAGGFKAKGASACINF